MTAPAGKAVGFAVATFVALGVTACTSHAKPTPHAAAKTASAAPTPAGPATFALPATLDGLTISKDSTTADLAGATKDDLVATSSGMTGDAVVGSYAGSGKDSAVLIGLPIATDDSDAQIDSVFNALRSMDLYAIDSPQPVGDGGMQCANATVLGGADLKLGICVMADNRGSSILLRFTKDAAATSAILTSVQPTFER
jgi:hypothetical protein